jgi:transposase
VYYITYVEYLTIFEEISLQIKFIRNGLKRKMLHYDEADNENLYDDTEDVTEINEDHDVGELDFNNSNRARRIRRRNPGIKNASVADDERERIINKLLDGCSVRDIASVFGKKYQTVNSIIKKYLKSGEIFKKKRGGDRRSKMSLEVKEQLLVQVDQGCTLTLLDLSNWVFSTFGFHESKSTIDRTLKQFH